MLVNNMGSPLIMNPNQTVGTAVEDWMDIYKHQVFTIPQTKKENDSLQITADLYEPCKHHGILETIISTMAPGRNDYFISFKGKDHL